MTEPSKEPEATTDKRDKASDAELEARLASLEERLKTIDAHDKAEQKPSSTASETQGAIGQAFRLSAEFVSGVLAGGAIGWAIDHLFGWSPWGLIVCLLLGFCAGMLNLLRASGVLKPIRFKDKR